MATAESEAEVPPLRDLAVSRKESPVSVGVSLAGLSCLTEGLAGLKRYLYCGPNLNRRACLEKCPECKGMNVQERVEMIAERVEGKRIEYGSRYSMCLGCKVTWYGREQMSEQMANRGKCL